MHLYRGSSQAEIGSIMHLSQATISRIIYSTRETISSKFVPSYLNNITRDKIKEETSAIARHLNDIEESEDRLITVWDGTYVYLNKSTNYRFQRVTYSGQKKRNFLKPMVAVTTNGYIIDIFGPNRLWAATVSDADILGYIMNTDWFQQFFKSGDVFILGQRIFVHQGRTIEKKF